MKKFKNEFLALLSAIFIVLMMYLFDYLFCIDTGVVFKFNLEQFLLAILIAWWFFIRETFKVSWLKNNRWNYITALAMAFLIPFISISMLALIIYSPLLNFYTFWILDFSISMIPVLLYDIRKTSIK